MFYPSFIFAYECYYWVVSALFWVRCFKLRHGNLRTHIITARLGSMSQYFLSPLIENCIFFHNNDRCSFFPLLGLLHVGIFPFLPYYSFRQAIESTVCTVSTQGQAFSDDSPREGSKPSYFSLKSKLWPAFGSANTEFYITQGSYCLSAAGHKPPWASHNADCKAELLSYY